MKWQAEVRYCVLIADAPCHGIKYHNYGKGGDNHPDGDPYKLVPEKLLEKYAQQNVKFHGIKITNQTDKMYSIFQ